MIGCSARALSQSSRRLMFCGQNRAVSSSKTLSLTPVRFSVSKMVQRASGFGLVGESDDREVVIVDGLDPVVVDLCQASRAFGCARRQASVGDLSAATAESARTALERSSGRTISWLEVEILSFLGPFRVGAHVEDRLFEVGAIEQLLQIKVIAMLADAVEGLVERSEALLTVEHQEGMLVPIETGAPSNSRAAKTRLASRTRRMLPAG